MIRYKFFNVGLAVAALALAGCGGGDDRGGGGSAADNDPLPAGERLAFETLAAGEDAGNVEKLYMVVTSDEELTRLWSTHLTTVPNLELPPIDFETQRLIVAFWGQEPSDSIDLTIDAVISQQQRALATVGVESLMGPSCVLDAVEISPYELVLLDRPEEPIEIEEQVNEIDCS